MQQNEEKLTIVDYNLHYKSAEGGHFVMDSETDLELAKVSDSVVRLEFKWFRRILRTDNNEVIVSLESLSHIGFDPNINSDLIDGIYRILKEHEVRNLEFIRANSFDIFDNFQNVYYSSFLDENLFPLDDRRRDMTRLFKTRLQEIGF